MLWYGYVAFDSIEGSLWPGCWLQFGKSFARWCHVITALAANHSYTVSSATHYVTVLTLQKFCPLFDRSCFFFFFCLYHLFQKKISWGGGNWFSPQWPDHVLLSYMEPVAIVKWPDFSLFFSLLFRSWHKNPVLFRKSKIKNKKTLKIKIQLAENICKNNLSITS